MIRFVIRDSSPLLLFTDDVKNVAIILAVYQLYLMGKQHKLRQTRRNSSRHHQRDATPPSRLITPLCFLGFLLLSIKTKNYDGVRERRQPIDRIKRRSTSPPGRDGGAWLLLIPSALRNQNAFSRQAPASSPSPFASNDHAP